MSNPCRICAKPAWANLAGTWACEGIADREVARRLGVDKSLVTRHRQRHVIAPLQQQLAIAGKGDAPRRERRQLADAATSDTPTPAQFVEAFFGLKAQAEKLQRIEDRLERVAALAEESASPNAVAQVAAQQLRSVEVGSKVAGVGGYAPARALDPTTTGQKFSINIIFGSTGETVSISPVLGSVRANLTGSGEDNDSDPHET